MMEPEPNPRVWKGRMCCWIFVGMRMLGPFSADLALDHCHNIPHMTLAEIQDNLRGSIIFGSSNYLFVIVIVNIFLRSARTSIKKISPSFWWCTDTRFWLKHQLTYLRGNIQCKMYYNWELGIQLET